MGQVSAGRDELILAIDPGTTESAWVLFDSQLSVIDECGQETNLALLARLKGASFFEVSPARCVHVDVMAVEMIKSYGNIMGDSVIETCVWIGRFIQAWNGNYGLLPRKTVVTTVCRNPAAKDKNVRQALIDRFVPPAGISESERKKRFRWALSGVKNDIWSALAVAVAWSDIGMVNSNKIQEAFQ